MNSRRHVVRQNEVYSAYLTQKYKQEVVFRNGHYFPSAFKPSNDDESVYKQCKDKYLVSDNLLSYLYITPQEQKEFNITFFNGLATSKEQVDEAYIRLLDGRMAQAYYIYSLRFEDKKDILICEEICSCFNIEVKAVMIKEKDGEINAIFFKSKELDDKWLVKALKNIKEGKLPVVDISFFELCKAEQRAFNRFIAIVSYLNILPHLDPNEVRAWTDGRISFPVPHIKYIEMLKKDMKDKLKEYKDYRVASAVENCDNNSISFCYSIRKYLNKKGFNCYLIDPANNNAKRYIITNYDKEINEEEEEIKKEFVKKDIDQIVGFYDCDDIKGLIKNKAEVKVKLNYKKGEDYFISDRTIPIKIKIPWSLDINLWTQEYLNEKGVLSAFCSV